MTTEELDLAVWPIFTRMTERGIRVDRAKLLALRDEVADELEAQLAMLEQVYAGRPLNPFSSEDVAKWMQEEGFTGGRRTKGKGHLKTDERTLSLLRDAHPAPGCVLECRGLKKLLGTFIDPTLEIAAKHADTVHPRWRLTKVKSGRPSMEDPNLLAFPTRDAFGKKVRECFVARPGYKLASVDFSQIEPRVGAALSQDPELLAVFRDKRDLYADTARRLFAINIPDKQLKDDPNLSRLYRQPSKVVWLACILNGMEAAHLYEELIRYGCGTPSAPNYRLAHDEGCVCGGFNDSACQQLTCTDFVRKRFEPYPLLGKLYRDHVRAAVMADGWAYTEGGRGRFLPALLLEGKRWPAAKLREEAERQAFNHLIQGTAQEIMKRAMLAADKSAAASYPLLQIYDEMIYEVPAHADYAAVFAAELAALMATTFRGVAIEANWSVSDTWGGLK